MKVGRVDITCLLLLFVLAMGVVCRDSEADGEMARGERRQQRARRHRRLNRRHPQHLTTTSSTELLQRGEAGHQQRSNSPSSPTVVELDAGMFQPDSGGLEPEGENTTNSRPTPTMSVQQFRGRMRDRQSRLFMIQNMILQRLGLKKQPNITALLPAETIEHFRERFSLIEQAGEHNERHPDEYFAKRFQAVPPSCEVPKSLSRTWQDSESFQLFFDVEAPADEADVETNVAAASVRLYKKPVVDCDCQRRRHNHNHAPGNTRRPTNEDDGEDNTEDDNDEEEDQIYITVHQYTRPAKRNKRARKKEVKRIALDKSYAGWVKIDVKSAVHEWLQKPKKNFGIELTVADQEGKALDPFDIFESYNCSEGFNETLPLPFPLTLPEEMEDDVITINDTLLLESNVTYPNLDMLTIELPKRQQESARSKRDIAFKRGCFREKIYVSFAEFGWNEWIIQPQGFETGFCRGSCSPLVNSKYLHGKYLEDGDKIMQRECCGPSLLKPLSLLRMNHKKELTIVVLDDFIVAECGCRP